MQLFFVPDIDGNHAIDLPEEEARHCIQVLRKRTGDAISLVDGKGTFYEGVLESADKRSCRVAIRSSRTTPPRPFHLHLAVAPTKQAERFEWMLEKITEIGVAEITPLLCRRSERDKIRADRLEKILVSAMKQSVQATLPKLNPLTPLPEFLRACRAEQRFIAYVDDEQKNHLPGNCRPGGSVCILIGPEGDFHPAEIALALENGFTPVSLGPTRLRTETAGMVAVHTVSLINLIQQEKIAL
ncbi:MAG: 16S rRNA (uracil(1498)-N(3))-methyltransferase [Lewinellaceae bacterium]|nr:16S rRNA (uracil(1498)-N(3))-methyltransferase [Lewinella sp.]MCB9279624.1 16S rRNA (uracil(1498)-N(3))-methyltransferase [Lewinellaceae bacterium]